MYVISLADYTPSPRYDETQWLTASIEEAPPGAVAVGPWEEIQSFELPTEANPANPTPRSFTTTNAQFATGWYRIRYEDGGGNLDVTDAISSSTVPQEIPVTDDIADLLYSRTVTPGGGVLGRFTEATTPSAARVKRLIDKSYKHVASATGLLTDPERIADSKNLITYYTAMLIELGSERTNVERFKELKDMYDAGMKTLIEALGGEGDSVVDETSTVAGPNTPVFHFPEPGIGVRTVW